jgi:hypothetical protein
MGAAAENDFSLDSKPVSVICLTKENPPLNKTNQTVEVMYGRERERLFCGTL